MGPVYINILKDIKNGEKQNECIPGRKQDLSNYYKMTISLVFVTVAFISFLLKIWAIQGKIGRPNKLYQKNQTIPLASLKFNFLALTQAMLMLRYCK